MGMVLSWRYSCKDYAIKNDSGKKAGAVAGSFISETI